MDKKDYHTKIEANVQGKKEAFAIKRIHFTSVDSTNNWAKAHTDQWASEGVTLVTASKQTAGRGRFKRTWISPANVNIYATFCLWFDLTRKDVGQIPQVLALAAAATLEKGGFSPKIKWPNDLLIEGKKVAGILCETIVEGDKRGVVCGIGLNVNMGKEDIALIDRPASSLLIEGGRLWDIDFLLNNLANIFLNSLKEFISSGFAPFFTELEKRSFFKKGDVVHFHDFRNQQTANFEALHHDGGVELRLMDGSLKIYHAGEFV